MRVAVYTIALNEAAHVERWASSAADADYRIVADTGSTDETVERLTRAAVTVHRIAVRPWRFDVARNAAMALIPAAVVPTRSAGARVGWVAVWRSLPLLRARQTGHPFARSVQPFGMLPAIRYLAHGTAARPGGAKLDND